MTLTEALDRLAEKFPATRSLLVMRDGIKNSLLSMYGGRVNMELEEEVSNECVSTLRARGLTWYEWGSGWDDCGGGGVLDWHTTSDHWVRIVFRLRVQDGYPSRMLGVERISIGSDASERFYPRVIKALGLAPIKTEKRPHRDAPISSGILSDLLKMRSGVFDDL